MPQLDKIAFFNQIFYLLFFFFMLYFFMLKYGLPTIVSALKVRQLFYLKVANMRIENSNKNFDARFLLLFTSLKVLSKNTLSHVSLESEKGIKEVSLFLSQNQNLLSLHKKFIAADLQINAFRFDKSSLAVRYREKQKKAQLKFDR